MTEPKRIWWARAGKLCALERPGGGGRSHRPERRDAEIEYLKAKGVRLIVSTMPTRHNLAHYEEAGIEHLHFPVGEGEEADRFDEIVVMLRRLTRKRGAVAIHANRYTDFVTAICAAHLYDHRGTDPFDALESAREAGMTVTDQVYALATGEEY
jgi:hypothetical protein